jgi:glycosyltransferase involved in cell wall biosynthesis
VSDASANRGGFRPPRVLAVATHPIQYQAPWFRGLAQKMDFSVLFVQVPNAQQQGTGFGVDFVWDVPVLEGYRWQRAPRVLGSGGLKGFFASHIARPVALLRKLQPDVLLLTGWHAWPLVQMLICASLMRVPVIMRGESNALRRRPGHVRALHRLLLSQCSAYLPIGRANRDFYRSYGIPEDQLFDTPYFVDNTHFMRAASDALPRRAELRQRWSVPVDAVCLCYAGKLEPKKRITDLLDALRIAMARPGRLHLLVVGAGVLMGQALEFVARHNLPVTFAGFLNQSEIPCAYVAADCLVLPSDHGETWGLVVNEAMACGRPAIVSDRVGCAADLVTEGLTGSVFPYGDTAALADRLVALAAQPALLRAMGEAARERVLRRYCAENSIAGTMRAVEHVLGRQ